MSNDSTISFEESYTSSYHKDCGECMTCVVSTTGSAVGWLDNQDQLIEIINAKAGQSGGDSSQESQYLDSQISSTKNDSLIDISSVDLDISTEECIRLWNRCSWQGQPDGRLVAITTDGIDKGDSASNSSNNLGLNSEASQWQETSQATTWDELSGDNDYIAGLMYGIKWRTTDPDDNNAAKELKYYFFNEEETIDGTWGSEPYQQEINAAIKAHNSFEEVGNLKFTEASTSNEAAIRWAFIDNEDAELATGSGGILGYAYMPGAEGYSGHIGINQDQYASPDNDQENLNPDPVSPGSYYHITFTHELGHALGLKHPHDSINTNPVFPGVDSPWDTGDNGLNATPWSVMTYNDVGANEYAPSFDAIGTYEGYLTGLGAFDIAAIQYLYGANNSFNTGDNIYSIDDTLDGFKSIWDAGGVDTIDGSSSSKRVTIDLRSATLKNQPGGGGFVSRINEEFKGYTIAYNSNGDAEIENANGSSFNDLIIGNEVNNILHGRDGNDNFFGGKGNDKIYGGNSFDTAEFTGEITDYNFVLDAINDLFKVSDSTLERDGEDSLSSVESIIFNQKQYEFPTDITLSATSFDENLDIGTTISTLTATDLDSLDQHTYSFVSGTESEANNFFRISGNQLILNDIADYETKDQYSIRIAATDADGLAIAKSFSLQVNDTDEANYNIDLSRTFLDEGDTLNTTVSTTDVDLGTELFWALEGNNFTQEDLRIGSLTGSNQVGADGNFSVSHTFAEDLTTEGLESLIVKLFSDQARQQLLAQSEAVQINDTSTSLEDGSGAVAFNYKLFSADSNQALDQLAVLGQGVDGTDRYKLEITAQSLLDQYNLESADVTLKFNPLIFQAINASDIQIGTDLPLANAVHIDNETGAVRIAASSLSDLAQGDGISSERLLASLTLDFDEGTLKTLGIQEDGSLAASPLIFEIEANQDETVFSR
ncbi:matrixin family metalloprotease, partial [Prochlorococcus sp. MIT 1306]